MAKVILRKTNRERRKLRVRKHISGTAAMPRLSVFRSAKHIYAQLIDDVAGKTLASASGAGNIAAAIKVGEDLAKAAVAKKIKKAVFDRNGYKYHGRVKSLADGARKGGLAL